MTTRCLLSLVLLHRCCRGCSVHCCCMYQQSWTALAWLAAALILVCAARSPRIAWQRNRLHCNCHQVPQLCCPPIIPHNCCKHRVPPEHAARSQPSWQQKLPALKWCAALGAQRAASLVGDEVRALLVHALCRALLPLTLFIAGGWLVAVCARDVVKKCLVIPATTFTATHMSLADATWALHGADSVRNNGAGTGMIGNGLVEHLATWM